MLTVPLIVFGAVFCLAWAYALGLLCLRRLPAAREIAFAVGAAVESCIVFTLLCAGAASAGVFLGIGAISILLAWRFRGPSFKDPPAEPASRAMRIAFSCILAIFGIYYFVHALAPEIQSDAITYHLGLPAEYTRTGAFPDRVTFFDVVPQGMEMLFTVAFSIGQHSAGKLVHFGFLLATLPLLLRIGRRLRLSTNASMAAAGIYFCAPVTGVAGTCAYTDAALVYYILATFYLLLVWHELNDDRYLIPAGIAAGFCYAIKFTGILILPGAAAAILAASRRIRPVLLLSTGGVLIALWMVRDAIVTGNPLAPLFNRWFPNPYFHASMEAVLANTLGSYGVARWRIPWELAVGGKLQGLYGPLFFLLPAGLIALRRREGRWCWLAAFAAALPWFFNIGGRFLMPAYVFMLLALMLAVPRAALACLIFQAVTCWPQAIELYNNANIWRLREFPWKAALRLVPEDAYLADHIDAYAITQRIQTLTSPQDRVFAMAAVAIAYTDRQTLEYWHSAEGDRLLDWVKNAGLFNRAPLYNVSAQWQSQPLRALRFRLNTAHPGEWCVHEAMLRDGEDRVRPSARWSLGGWPNISEMTAAFDDNLASRWRTWTPMRPGMYMQIDFERPQWLNSAVLVSHTPIYKVPVEFYGQDKDGRWIAFGPGKVEERVWEDLRRPAMRAVKRAGYSFLLAPGGTIGLGPFSELFGAKEEEWGIDPVASVNGYSLYRIR
jgi:Dolichyl-phosphate-mannose-protein mannosyltransferase